jgi:glycosyltransferase involved in cell wall biosynthesis
MVAVSVIIPVYNCSQYLPQCLTSLYSQTLRDLEIICVNDASTDNSISILQEYAAKDSRIKIINLAENKGAAVARNIAIENAQGKYLGFVDGDDFIDHNFYEKLYAKALETDADSVKGNIITYCPKTSLKRREAWIDINEDAKKHKAGFCFSFTSAIYKKSLIQENSVRFLEGLIHFEDPYFTIKAALFYKKLEVIDDVFYYYVSNPDSTSRKKITIKHAESLVFGVEKVLDLLDEFCFDKTHYMIVFNFLLGQVLSLSHRVYISDEISVKAISGLFILYKRCRYKEECTIYHFLEEKKKQKKEAIQQLRDKVKNDLKNA